MAETATSHRWTDKPLAKLALWALGAIALASSSGVGWLVSRAVANESTNTRQDADISRHDQEFVRHEKEIQEAREAAKEQRREILEELREMKADIKALRK